MAKAKIESGEQLDYDLRKDIRIYDFLKYGVDYLKNSTPPQSPSSAPTLSAEPNGSAGGVTDHGPKPRVSLKSIYYNSQD